MSWIIAIEISVYVIWIQYMQEHIELILLVFFVVSMIVVYNTNLFVTLRYNMVQYHITGTAVN